MKTRKKAFWRMIWGIALAGMLFFAPTADAMELYRLEVGTTGNFSQAPDAAVWTSSDPYVVRIVEGEIHAVGVGYATVTAKGATETKTYHIGVELPGEEKKYTRAATLRADMTKAIEKHTERMHCIVRFKVPLNGKDEQADAQQIDKKAKAFFPKSDDFFVAYSDSFTLRYATNRIDEENVELHCTITFHYNPASAVAAKYRGQNVSFTVKEQKLYERCEAILKRLGVDAMTHRYEKVLAIHDDLVKRCAFDLAATEAEEGWWESADSYCAYGALIQRKATCKGYAQAMKLLLEACGVPCDYVVGFKNVRHGWNRVQLDDGKWYHIDASGDDPVPDQKDRIRYTYFCVTDAQLKKTHTWEDNRHRCQATTYSYKNILKKLEKRSAAKTVVKKTKKESTIADKTK